MTNEEKYDILLGAMEYRREVLMEKTMSKVIPQVIRAEYQDKLEKLEELRYILFI